MSSIFLIISYIINKHLPPPRVCGDSLSVSCRTNNGWCFFFDVIFHHNVWSLFPWRLCNCDRFNEYFGVKKCLTLNPNDKLSLLLDSAANNRWAGPICECWYFIPLIRTFRINLPFRHLLQQSELWKFQQRICQDSGSTTGSIGSCHDAHFWAEFLRNYHICILLQQPLDKCGQKWMCSDHAWRWWCFSLCHSLPICVGHL